MREPKTQKLGVGVIIGRSFGIVFRHFPSVLVLCFVPTLAGLMLSSLVLWGTLLPFEPELDFTDGRSILRVVLSILVESALNGVTTALVVQLAYDTVLDRRPHPGRYVGPALRVAIPVAVLGLMVGLVVVAGLVALVIPGLWVYAVFFVIPPVIVIENVRFAALQRSAALTRLYRWPIVGALVLILFCVGLLESAGGFLVSLVGAELLLALPLWTAIVVEAFFSALGYGLIGIATALIYARLREIKDGVGVDDIVAVFN